MSLEQKYGLGQFDGKDYEYWRFCLLTLIRAEELEYVLEAEYSGSEDENSDEDVTDEKSVKDTKGAKSAKHVKDAKDGKQGTKGSKSAKDAKDAKDGKQGTSAQQKKWIRDDRKCMAIIIRHLADSHIVYARNADTSVALLGKLDEMYKRRGAASSIYLKREWQNLKMKSDENLTEHFRKFDEMVTSIRACRCKLDTTDVIDQLLMSLPDSYAVTIEVIESMTNPSMLVVRMKLLNRESKLKQQQSENETRCDQIAMLADIKDGKARHDDRNSSGQKTKPFTCYNCDGYGHIAKYCKKPKRATRNSSDSSSSAECNLVARAVSF